MATFFTERARGRQYENKKYESHLDGADTCIWSSVWTGTALRTSGGKDENHPDQNHHCAFVSPNNPPRSTGSYAFNAEQASHVGVNAPCTEREDSA
jgi:hypothetical protein